jgi:hypothetical protein
LAGTAAAPEQVAEALRVNTDSRLRTRKIELPIMAGLAPNTIIPDRRPPNDLPGEVPSDQPPDTARRNPSRGKRRGSSLLRRGPAERRAFRLPFCRGLIS